MVNNEAKDIDVVAVGTLNIDLIVIGDAPRDVAELLNWVAPSKVEITAAGSVGYCAVDLARLGLRVSMLSSVADDVPGRTVLSALSREGIDVEPVQIEPGVSGIGLYLLLFGSRKRPLTGRFATHSPWPVEITPMMDDRLRRGRLLHCGGYLHYPRMWGEPTERLYRRARELGLITSLDTQFPFEPVDPPWLKCFGGLLPLLDLLFTDEDEARSITGCATAESAAEALVAEGPKLVVVKKGAEGAVLATRQGEICQPAFPVDRITDTIGAGDAFDAGVIYGTLAGWPLTRTARFATAVSALSLKGMGGTQTAPTLLEVEEFLGERYKVKGKR